ncbi:LysM domain [uncultured Caudovirales phage]|uniref:LysM domain n=1 Tax=uncultured Caudovirales phage TaxID=2100421 RepID=A0A6J5L8K7_9CAUD|nr:LysM domain [uncultured Caudovirales phage]
MAIFNNKNGQGHVDLHALTPMPTTAGALPSPNQVDHAAATTPRPTIGVTPPSFLHTGGGQLTTNYTPPVSHGTVAQADHSAPVVLPSYGGNAPGSNASPKPATPRFGDDNRGALRPPTKPADGRNAPGSNAPAPKPVKPNPGPQAGDLFNKPSLTPPNFVQSKPADSRNAPGSNLPHTSTDPGRDTWNGTTPAAPKSTVPSQPYTGGTGPFPYAPLQPPTFVKPTTPKPTPKPTPANPSYGPGKIPGAGPTPKPTPKPTPSPKPTNPSYGPGKIPGTAPAPSSGQYTVQHGDSLWSIAEKNKPAGMSTSKYWAQIMKKNPSNQFKSKNPSLIYSGEKVNL